MIVLKWVGLALLILLLSALAFGFYQMFQQASQSQKMTPALGLVDQQFTDCPESPNCVSSFARDLQHGIPSLTGDLEDFAALATFIAETPGADIMELTPNYLRATYKSGFFGFVDDLELQFDGSRIQVRSASRVGYGDFDANRNRVESLRNFLMER